MLLSCGFTNCFITPPATLFPQAWFFPQNQTLKLAWDSASFFPLFQTLFFFPPPQREDHKEKRVQLPSGEVTLSTTAPLVCGKITRALVDNLGGALTIQYKGWRTTPNSKLLVHLHLMNGPKPMGREDSRVNGLGLYPGPFPDLCFLGRSQSIFPSVFPSPNNSTDNKFMSKLTSHLSVGVLA